MKFKPVLAALLADEKFSISGLAESTGVSSKSVYDWVNGKFEPNKKHYAKIAQYFQITESELLSRVFTPDPDTGWLKLPILGEVPAGNPIEAIELIIRYFSIPEELKNQMDFGLIVKGDSMTGGPALTTAMWFLLSTSQSPITVRLLSRDSTELPRLSDFSKQITASF